MKNIVWRNDLYKQSSVLAAYINNIRVAVIRPMHDDSRFDAKLLLPGLPKGINSHSRLDKAKEHLEERINFWFEKVE